MNCWSGASAGMLAAGDWGLSRDLCGMGVVGGGLLQGEIGVVVAELEL